MVTGLLKVFNSSTKHLIAFDDCGAAREPEAVLLQKKVGAKGCRFHAASAAKVLALFS